MKSVLFAPALLGLVGILLGGCVTLDDLRSGQPNFAFVSAKPVDEMERCIVSELQGVRIVGVPMPAPVVSRTNTGVAISYPGDNRMVIDIQDNGAGSQVQYFSTPIVGMGPVQSAVRQCR